MIDNFLLLPLNELSDHSKIVTIFKAPSLKDASQSDDYKWKPRGIHYKWDANNAQNFIKTLTASTEEIKEISQRIEAGLVHSTGEKIQQLFINAAKISLKNKIRISRKIGRKGKKTKKWFDNDCKQTQHQVRKLGKQKHSSPEDSLLREKYHEKLKEYKRTCKSKKYFYTQDSLNQINSALDDPSSFWKMWKQFDDSDTERTKLEIPGEKLFSHYSQLHSQHQNDDVPEPEPFNKTTTSTKLNTHFSKKEFMLVIKNLKNNKSEGYDCISNEMIKNSPDIILDLIYKFMNLCFEKSLIPNSWAYHSYTKREAKVILITTEVYVYPQLC